MRACVRACVGVCVCMSMCLCVLFWNLCSYMHPNSRRCVYHTQATYARIYISLCVCVWGFGIKHLALNSLSISWFNVWSFTVRGHWIRGKSSEHDLWKCDHKGMIGKGVNCGMQAEVQHTNRSIMVPSCTQPGKIRSGKLPRWQCHVCQNLSSFIWRFPEIDWNSGTPSHHPQ